MLRILVLVITLLAISASPDERGRTLPTSNSCVQELHELVSKFEKGQPRDLLSIAMNSGQRLKEFGQFEACKRDPKKKYALMTVGTGSSMILYLGFCGPAECKAEDYTEIMEMNRKAIEAAVSKITGSKATGLVFYTYSPTDWSYKLDTATFLSLAIIIGLLGLSAFAFFYKNRVNPAQRESSNAIKDGLETTLVVQSPNLQEKIKAKMSILSCFNVGDNLTRWFADTGKNDPNLRVFNGIRFFMICWVIFGHNYVAGIYLASNLEDLPNMLADPRTLYVYAAEFAVDVFFLMSGFFFVFIFSRRFNNRNFGAKEYGMTILHRLLRIIPTYAVVIILLWKISQFFGNGPLWQMFVNIQDENCSKNSWEDLLFVNNFVFGNQLKKDCIGWGWYLGCEMQIFLIMPLVTVAVLRNKTFGKSLIWCLIAASLIYSYFLVVVKGYKEAGKAHSSDFNQHYYVVPWTRAPPYLFGALVGFWYVEEKGTLAKKIASSRLTQIICSIIGAITVYGIINVISPLQKDRNAFTIYEYALYIAGSRLVFVAGLTLFLLPAFLGATLPNIILGNKFFELTAKLNFGTYLFHFVVIQSQAYNSYQSIFLSHETMLYRTIGTATISFFCAFFLHIFVELPFANLEQLIFLNKKSRSS